MKSKPVLLLISVQIDPDANKAPPGWLLGESNGKKGLFPANYVERITEEEAKSQKDDIGISPPESSSTVKSLAAALSMQFAAGGSIGPSVAVSQNSAIPSANVNTEVRRLIWEKFYMWCSSVEDAHMLRTCTCTASMLKIACFEAKIQMYM